MLPVCDTVPLKLTLLTVGICSVVSSRSGCSLSWRCPFKAHLADGGYLLGGEEEVGVLSVCEHIVDGHDAVGAAGAAVVDDGGVGLDPDPTARVGQPAVVAAVRLALVQH